MHSTSFPFKPVPLMWLTRLALAFTALPMVTASAYAQVGSVASHPIVAGERLSDWLLRQPTDTFLEGLMWSRPEDMQPQRALKQRLLQQGFLRDWLQNAPVTGRSVIANPDVRWLQAHPQEDPVLRSGDCVSSGARPEHVAVLRSNGTVCHVQHQASARAVDYIQACEDVALSRPWAWVIQPDGRSSKVGLESWNDEAQTGIAPGAWLWAPARQDRVPEEFSEQLAKFVGTQGPAPSPHTESAKLAAPTATQSHTRYQQLSASDWGGIGLLQTPTSRMESAGHVRVSASHVLPYTNLNVLLQPLDWVEAGFRYTLVSNRIYGISTRDYTDKSFDLKLRLAQESSLTPEVAVGWRDLGGTGLFAGEYLVTNKRTGNFDWSLGLGWGYLAGRGQWTNPFGVVSEKFKTRQSPEVGEGGKFSLNTYFRGPVSPFGGVQWQTPLDGLRLKLEYDGNDYQREPLKNNQKQRSRLNAGLAWMVKPGMDLSLGVERGNRIVTGITLDVDLSTLQTPKVHDPAGISFTRVVPATVAPNAWQQTSALAEQQSGWKVTGIRQHGDTLLVDVDQAEAVYRQERLERVVPVLHKDSPPDIRQFAVNLNERGLPHTTQLVDRFAWMETQTQPSTPATRPVVFKDLPAGEAAGPANIRPHDRGTFSVSPSYTQILGGPDAFVLYQLGLGAWGEYRFTDNTWASGAVNVRLAGNFAKFKYTAPSNLPRVRTYQREFATTSRVTVPNLQLTHVNKLGENHFVSLYGGALESMYAGVGAEWLYRPWRSPIALGLDVNRVRQRDFRQNFQLRDYSVTTGHATVYWDTGWQDFIIKLSGGQYLAGDKGATLDLSRRFNNGVTVGAYGTKTNVSAKDFGEGSFDKGVYVSIPFDVMLATSSKEKATLRWTPLTRDGGARLERQVQLYELTSLRDPKAMVFRSAQPASPKTGDAVFE